MDSAGRRRSPDTVQRLLRIWLWINDALILASSAIVTGILAHFIRKYHERGTHVIFEEVIVSIPFSRVPCSPPPVQVSPLPGS